MGTAADMLGVNPDQLNEDIFSMMAVHQWDVATAAPAEIVDKLDLLTRVTGSPDASVALWNQFVPAHIERPTTLQVNEQEQRNRPHVFGIPDGNLTQFRRVMARINARSKKLGFPPIVIKELGAKVEWRDIYVESAGVKHDQVYVHYMHVEGEHPVKNGWRFLGVLEHLDGKGNNLVKGDVPKEFFDCPPNCQHCNTKRLRNETYILQNVEDGSHVQVGTSCMTDFFNGDDPMKHAAFLQMLFEMDAELLACEELDEHYGGRIAPLIQPMSVLELAAIPTLEGKWITSNVAEALMVESSGQAVRALLLGDKNRPRPVVLDEHKKFAQEVLEWLHSDETAAEAQRSSYLHNLVTLASADCISDRHVTIFASACVSYQRYLAKKIELNSVADSSHVGIAGNKLESHLVTVIGKVNIPGGQWGDKTLYRFKDDDDNLLVWFSSGQPLAKINDRIHINGTIAEHSEFRGAKQTVLQRVTSNEDKLIAALKTGGDAAIKKVLKRPVNLDVAEIRGMAPVCYCAATGNEKYLRILLDMGANVDFGAPHIEAARGGYQGCIDILEEYGADFSKTFKFDGSSSVWTFEEALKDGQDDMRKIAICSELSNTNCTPETAQSAKANWRRIEQFPIETLTAPEEGWKDYFMVLAAQADEEKNDDDMRHLCNIENGIYNGEPIIILDRGGQLMLLDGRKRIGAAVTRGDTHLSALVGMYVEPVLDKIFDQSSSAKAVGDVNVEI